MQKGPFYLQLILLTLVIVAGAYFVIRQPQFSEDAALTWISIGFFTILCALMYHQGYRAAHSDNKNDFSNVFLGFVVGKLFFCAILILGYYFIVQPTARLFVIPFFGVYLVYTIFEVYFMSRLGRMNT